MGEEKERDGEKEGGKEGKKLFECYPEVITTS